MKERLLVSQIYWEKYIDNGNLYNCRLFFILQDAVQLSKKIMLKRSGLLVERSSGQLFGSKRFSPWYMDNPYTLVTYTLVTIKEWHAVHFVNSKFVSSSLDNYILMTGLTNKRNTKQFASNLHLSLRNLCCRWPLSLTHFIPWLDTIRLFNWNCFRTHCMFVCFYLDPH